jgi:hypothetical protein
MSEEELITVPEDADEDFDPNYEPVEDKNVGEGHEVRESG